MTTCTRDVYSPTKYLFPSTINKYIEAMAETMHRFSNVGLAHGDFYSHNILVSEEGERRDVRESETRFMINDHVRSNTHSLRLPRRHQAYRLWRQLLLRHPKRIRTPNPIHRIPLLQNLVPRNNVPLRIRQSRRLGIPIPRGHAGLQRSTREHQLED